jgi:vitamin B12 transporter
MFSRTSSRAILALAAFPALLAAQPAPDDGAVVVSASRTEQRIRDAIPHTTVLTQKDIRDSQLTDLPSLLRREAGFEMQQNGGIGTLYSPLSLRGGASAQALVLVDGVRFEDVSQGSSAIQHIMLDEVERVEIVRGNVSALYGSGAIGGVIQVFTRRGRGTPAPYADFTFGRYGTTELRGGYGGQVGDTRFNVTASRFETRGFSAIDPQRAPLANPDPDGYQNESFAGSLSHRFSGRHELGASFFKANGRLDYDGVSAFQGDTPTTVHQSGQDVGTMQAWWEARFVDAWKSRLTVAEGKDYRIDTRDAVLSSRSNTRNRQILWNNDLQLTPEHTVSAGVEELRQELASSSVGERFREVSAVRLGYLGKLGAHSLQGNWRREDYSDFGKAETYFLGYGFDLTDTWRVTASNSTAFRAPTFVDLYFPFGIGNPLLRPERARTNELGLQWASGADRVKVVLFETKYQDAIVFSAGTTRNVGRASTKGVESSYSGNILGFDLRASLTVQDPVEQAPDGQELPAIRRSKAFGSVSAYRSLGAWRLGAQALGAGSRRDQNVTTFVRQDEPGYTVLDLTARYNFDKTWFAAMRLENALDKKYSTVSGYQTARAGLFLTVGWHPGGQI